MKTLEELYKEVMASDELKKEFLEASKNKEGTEAWLKKHDCEATGDELCAFLKGADEGEMKDEDVENVAGGDKKFAAWFSVVSLGAGCAYVAIGSTMMEDTTAKQCLEGLEDIAEENAKNQK